ncbi:ImmA/IrrE family metallo-endopeptidase [Aneurinibacillus uraniidurans]|uniref:ImmA/IrrE family metallo-endopeptidase n=1 Tax=Aneurinibacillus uraniidurans TaxID=2966586 RepID=UPI00234B95D1|nr:ImmA/IrrE family metallo-endopeptidase [Aneurinibacillus sp. B1]WCN36611.1 ImmA/IrrE family metallo-endopeptidase [Aneurinibacillus sp. B1]
MWEYYRPGMIEETIEDIYRSHSILHPWDLRIENLMRTFSIDLRYWFLEPKCMWSENQRVIFLTKGLTGFAYKQTFFHEFGHVLVHEGDQLAMSNAQRQLMELDIRRFLRFAMMPAFMLRQLEPYLLSSPWDLVESFEVPYEYVINRLKDIRRRIWSRYWLEQEAKWRRQQQLVVCS